MLVAYKGRSFWPSKLIRWMSWSDYSHVAWMTKAGGIYEAWSPKVRYCSSVHVGHQKGTEVEIFTIPNLTQEQRDVIENYLCEQVGKPYDWVGVFRFVPRLSTNKNQTGRWFCSELVMAALKKANINPLKRIPNYKVTPGMLVTSPIFTFKTKFKVGS